MACSACNCVCETKEKINYLELELHQERNRVDCLFTSLKGVETKLMGQPFQPIKPHKCPICEGKGKHPHPLTELMFYECDACEGKGIVWG